MGVVKIGRKEYYGSSVKLSGNCLYLDGIPILHDIRGMVYIKSDNVSIDKIISENSVLVDGNINRCFVNNSLCVVGKVYQYFVESKRYFFNGTSKEEIKKHKAKMSSKIDGVSKTIVHLSGDFDKLFIDGCHWVSLKGNVNYVSTERNLYVKGKVFSAKVYDSMYVSER